MLAVIDAENQLQVINLTAKGKNTNTDTIALSEANVKAVTWSADYEDMFAYTNEHNVLSIHTGELKVYQQLTRGPVVGFKANKVFTLQNE